CAVAQTSGLALAFGASSGKRNAEDPPGATQRPLTCFHPAALSPAAAALGSNFTGAWALGSEAHDDGGMGVSARTPVPSSTSVISFDRSSACSSARRTRTSRSSRWLIRRFRTIPVKVERGYLTRREPGDTRMSLAIEGGRPTAA